MELNDNESNDENIENRAKGNNGNCSSILTATSTSKNHHPPKQSGATTTTATGNSKSNVSTTTKKRHVKGDQARKRRRSTSSTSSPQVNADVENTEVELSSSSYSSYSASNDGNVSVPSLQTQSQDGTTMMENGDITSSNSGSSNSMTTASCSEDYSSQSQPIFPMINENDVPGIIPTTTTEDPIPPQQIRPHSHETSSLFGTVMRNVTASSSVVATTVSAAVPIPVLPSASSSIPSSTTGSITTTTTISSSSTLSNDPITPARVGSLQRTPMSARRSSSSSRSQNHDNRTSSLLMQQNNNNNKLFTMNSPGGFQLLDFVNGFGNSPLFHKFQKSSNRTSTYHHHHQRTPDPTLRKKLSTTTIRNNTILLHTPQNNHHTDDENAFCSLSSSSKLPVAPPPIPATPRHEVEWHECTVQNKCMHWMDWSMKSTIEIQYQPSNALDAFFDPHGSNSTNPQTLMIRQYHQQSAVQQFVTGDGGNHAIRTQSDDDNDNTAVTLYAALCYWQHPAVHPLPDEFFVVEKRNLPPPPRFHKSKSLVVPTELPSSSLYSNDSGSNSRMAMPPPKKHMRAFTTSTTNTSDDKIQPNTNETLLRTRILEWKEAFQSLYICWLNKIQLLNQQWDEISSNTNSDVALGDFHKSVTDTYFYAIGKGHTILFRVGMINDTSSVPSDSNSSARTLKLQPEIVMSSSTQSLRQKLRSMNVTLYLLYEWNCHTGAFDDEYLYGSSTNAVDGTETASPNVMAELIALRRQQMSRWRVGPDIAVQMKPKKTFMSNQYTPSPKSVPPLRIIGTEQCASFFDIYYHSLGQMGTTNYVENYHVKDVTIDIPLLLCRRLGPFLHASIKLNSPSRKKGPTTETDSASTNTTIEIRGYLLPCTIRDLTCAIIDAMIVAKTTSRQGKVGLAVDNDNIHGQDTECSSHFVVQSTVHPGDELNNVSGLGAIGSHCSKRFNGPWSWIDTMNEHMDMQHCHQDEVLRLAVWDESRPTALAIKLHHNPTIW